MNTKLTTEEFLDLFADEWDKAQKEGRVPKVSLYENRNAWKSIIEGDDGIIRRIMDKLIEKYSILKF